jgi:hypothetical protein
VRKERGRGKDRFDLLTNERYSQAVLDFLYTIYRKAGSG